MSGNVMRIPCLVCDASLKVRLARGRKSGKPFVMLICPRDGRHFRGFVTSQPYVKEVLARLEGQGDRLDRGDALQHGTSPSRRSKTNLERGRDA